MHGTMMDFPLTLNCILERMGKQYPKQQIISRNEDGSLHRYTYLDFYKRARALAEALQRAGLKKGDRVATLMWNHHRHLEAYFGIPAAGGITHTLNLRLHPDELAFIVDHAQDRFLIVDDLLLPVLEKFKDRVRFERTFVVSHGVCDRQLHTDYEEFLGSATGNFEYPPLASDDGAAMCYTSGTTGKSKGVLYSHASLVLHSFAFALPDCFAISMHDNLMPCAPMFHANSHGVPFVAALIGSKITLPGPHPCPEDLLDLFHSEQVTMLSCVPTVWLSILEALERSPQRWKLSAKLRLLCAGTAVPEAMIRRTEKLGIHMIHGWGMTETTPAAVACTVKPHLAGLDEDSHFALRARQGFAMPFVELRAQNENGEIPWDAQTLGELHVRGPWVAGSYFQMPEANDRWTPDGWLKTGDVVTICPDGYIKIADRSKDLIKSGGEWISSVDLENRLMAHPAVREAAVIAVPHPKWDERPVAVVVRKPGTEATQEELREFLAERFAKWQLPDAVIFVDDIPHTSTGKVSKLDLRRKYGSEAVFSRTAEIC